MDFRSQIFLLKLTWLELCLYKEMWLQKYPFWTDGPTDHLQKRSHSITMFLEDDKSKVVNSKFSSHMVWLG